MIRTLALLTTFLFLCETSHGQSSQRNAPYGKSDVKMFPFTTSSSILAISFAPEAEGIDTVVTRDSARVKSMVNGSRDTLGHEGVLEIVKLRRKEIDDLHHVLNELDCHGPTSRRLCYNPRNAILFIDQHGAITAELEVSFECHEFETKPQHLYVRDGRECMYEALRKVFVSAGVRYGVGSGK